MAYHSSLRRWIVLYARRVGRKWPAGTLTAFICWAAWYQGMSAISLFGILLMLFVGYISFYALPFWSELWRNEPIPFAWLMLRAAIVALSLAIIFGWAWFLRNFNWLVDSLTEAGYSVDKDMLITCLVTTAATVVCIVLALLRCRQLSLSAEIEPMDLKRYRFLVEASWVLAAIALSLIPGTFRLGWFPNVLTSVVLPLMIFHAREDYAHFREFGIHTQDDPILGRVVDRFVQRVKGTRLAASVDREAFSSQDEKDAKFNAWLSDTPRPARIVMLAAFVVVGIQPVAMIGAIAWSIATTGPLLQRIFLGVCFILAFGFVLRALGPDLSRFLKGLWRGSV